MNVEEKALKLIEDSLNKKCNGLECKVVKNNIDLRLEIIRLNRQIDLMADFISKYHCFELMVYDLDDKCMHERECKECIKQYFERKSDK